jgi:5-formyltetrahydrofolate cyclo-ligase
MPVIFLFIDGVGLGNEASENPLLNDSLNGFSFMSGNKYLANKAEPVHKHNHLFVPVDATLGVKGLPQSGTGQAALFSGENAPQKIGKHFGPYPHSGIRPLLRKHSLFKKAQAKVKSCSFVNAYPDAFFRHHKERNRWTCTTLMTRSANIRLNTVQDVKNETAVTAGLTQESWSEKMNISVPVITPEKAAKRLINQAGHYDLLLHEYYLTDKAGHSREPEKAGKYLSRYDRFLQELIRTKPKNATIVLCSDHGNVEDLSTKTHTFNKVPLFAYGPGSESFNHAESIMDVTPGILNVLSMK